MMLVPTSHCCSKIATAEVSSALHHLMTMPSCTAYWRWLTIRSQVDCLIVRCMHVSCKARALTSCADCLLQKTCTAFNYQSGSSAASDGTPAGTCQLVASTQSGTDTSASGTSQPFIGGLVTRTS